jgi:hypothetical protein
MVIKYIYMHIVWDEKFSKGVEARYWAQLAKMLNLG